MAVFSNFPVTLPVLFQPTDTAYHPLHPLLCSAGKERGKISPRCITNRFYTFGLSC